MMDGITVDGYRFDGPYILNKDTVPAEAGIILVSTEAGEGIKFLCIEESNDMAAFIANSDKKDFWLKTAYHGQIDLYIMRTDCSDAERASIVDSMIHRREAYLLCQEKKILEDDW